MNSPAVARHKMTAEQRTARFDWSQIPESLRQALDGAGILVQADRILPFTVLSVSRICGIIHALRLIDGVKGSTIEIGCNAGGASRLIGLLNGGRTHWVCDTFEGLVDCGPLDTDLTNGAFSNRLAKAADVAARLSDLPQVRVVAGVMPAAAPAQMSTDRFALAHVDVDTYRSMIDCFEFVAARISPRGIVILDDVLAGGTVGGQAAWKEIMPRFESRFRIIARNAPQIILQFN